MSKNIYNNHCTVTASAMHLLVDCLCVCSLYILATTNNYDDIISTILIYNIIAFCSQPLTGIVADNVNRKEYLLYTSVALLATAVVVTDFCTNNRMPLLPVAILLGTGNSLFHVWGGKQTADKSNNSIISIGAFVAPGALGLSIGYLFHSYQLLYISLILIAILSLVYTIIETKEPNPKEDTLQEIDTSGHKWQITLLAIVVLSTIVMIRSLLGDKFSTSIIKSDTIILLTGIISTAGKVSGGIITKQIGLKLSILILVAAAILFYTIHIDGIYTALCGLFIINCTMPITLYLANIVLKGREGLAFGILAASLIPGYIIATL